MLRKTITMKGKQAAPVAPERENMQFFITALRGLAACLITNAHYTGIYPSDMIANGGMIGDILFFAVSGYCLYNVKGSFPRWYGKRLWRCYLPVVLMTAVYMLLGYYSLSEQTALWWYVYPTYYHFVASIIVLYIPFYFCMKVDWLKKQIPTVMALIAVAALTVYILGYDKTYYHIDKVREPMVRFLFMESMLLGAWMRRHEKQWRGRFCLWSTLLIPVLFAVYFASKLYFSRGSRTQYQILNQVAVFALLFVLFRTFMGLDGKLEKLPGWIRSVISYLAMITLEIYVVQYVLIDLVRPMGKFPLNWLTATAAILAAATALHYVCALIYKGVDRGLAKLKKGGAA